MKDLTPTISSLFDLDGKVALVTGGSRGPGRSMCSALASAGSRVVVGEPQAGPV